MEYDQSIESIMREKLKAPGALIDSEKLASHVSVQTAVSVDK